MRDASPEGTGALASSSRASLEGADGQAARPSAGVMLGFGRLGGRTERRRPKGAGAQCVRQVERRRWCGGLDAAEPASPPGREPAPDVCLAGAAAVQTGWSSVGGARGLSACCRLALYRERVLRRRAALARSRSTWTGTWSGPCSSSSQSSGWAAAKAFMATSRAASRTARGPSCGCWSSWSGCGESHAITVLAREADAPGSAAAACAWATG